MFVQETVQQSCSATEVDIDRLLMRLIQVEKALAELRPGQTSDQIQQCTVALKSNQSNMNGLQAEVNACLQTTDELCVDGADVLSPEEFHNLRSHRDQLRDVSANLQGECSSLIDRIKSGSELNNTFALEADQFQSWISKAQQQIHDLNEKSGDPAHHKTSRAQAQELTNAIGNRQSDLNQLTDIQKQFSDQLHQFAQIQTANGKYSTNEVEDSISRARVNDLREKYENLTIELNQLLSRQSSYEKTFGHYTERCDHTEQWLNHVTTKIGTIKSTGTDAGSDVLNSLLADARAVQESLIGEGDCVSQTRDAGDSYLRAIQTHCPKAHDSQNKHIDTTCQQYEQRLEDAKKQVTEHVGELQSILTQAVGASESVDKMNVWLRQVEQIIDTQKPIPLVKPLLDEQIREQQVLKSQVAGRRSVLEDVQAAADKFITSSPSAARKISIGDQVQTLKKRFDVLERKCQAWGANLADADRKLGEFHSEADALEAWLTENTDKVSGRYSDISKHNQAVEEIQTGLPAKQEALKHMKIVLRDLLDMPCVTEQQQVNERMQAIDLMFMQLQELLTKRTEELKQQSESMNEFAAYRDNVTSWLSDKEQQVDGLPPVALTMTLCDRQKRGMQALLKEQIDYQPTVQKCNQIGEDYMTKLRPKSQSPENPTGTSSMKSSGFWSSDAISSYAQEELTGVQKDLFDINQRFEHLGKRMTDRDQELDSVMQQLAEYEAHRDDLMLFVQASQHQLDSLSTEPDSVKASTAALQTVNVLANKLKTRRPELDASRSRAHQLTRLKTEEQVPGLTELKVTQEQLEEEYESVSDQCARRMQWLNNHKEYLNTIGQLRKWLSAKRKMINTLQPVTSDPASLKTQLQQVDVLKDEVDGHGSEFERLNDLTLQLIEKDNDESVKLQKQTAEVTDDYGTLSDDLKQRYEALHEATQLSDKFNEGHQEFRQWLHSHNNELEALSAVMAPEDKQIHLGDIENLQTKVEGGSAQVDALQQLSTQLCECTTDPTSTTDINQRMQFVKQPYDELNKKINSLLDATKNQFNEGAQFDGKFDELLQWTNAARKQLQDLDPTSAEYATLDDQVKQFDGFYQEVLHREGQVVVVRATAAQLLAKSKNDQLANRIDQLDAQWDPLLDATKKRHSSLSNAKELATHWQHLLDTLSQKYDQLEIEVTAIADADICESRVASEARQSQINEFKLQLSALERELSGAQDICSKYLNATQVDQDGVKQNLEQLEQRHSSVSKSILALKTKFQEQSDLWKELDQSINDVKGAVDRCESQVKNTDMTSSKSCGKLRSLLDDLEGPVQQGLNKAYNSSENLSQFLKNSGVEQEANKIGDANKQLIDEVRDRAKSLDDVVRVKLGELESAEGAIGELRTRVSSLGRDVKQMESEFADLPPVARDLPELESQSTALEQLGEQIGDKKQDVEKVKADWVQLTATGNAAEHKAGITQLSHLADDLEELDKRAKKRSASVIEMRQNLDGIVQELKEAHGKILDLLGNQVFQSPIESESGKIQGQQESLRTFRDELKPTDVKVKELLARARELIRSANPAVDTNWLESETHTVSDAWQELQNRLDDREKQLDGALLGVGNYRDTLEKLLSWLTDTEELISGQKPPSPDSKVVRAQLQEQKLLQRMVEDKQGSIDSFSTLVERMQTLAPDNQEYSEDKQQVNERYDRIVDQVRVRMQQLKDMLDLSQQWADSLGQSTTWLKDKEQQLAEMSNVPTDEQRINQLIESQKCMAVEVEDYRPFVDSLVEIKQRMAGLVGQSDAEELELHLAEVEERYDQLGAKQETVGQLLVAMATGVVTFFDNTQQLADWLDEAAVRLEENFEPVAVYPEPLDQQCMECVELAEQVHAKEMDVRNIMEEGRELCQHTNSEDATNLHNQLESLRKKYTDLTRNIEQKIGVLEQAVPLVDTFHVHYNKIDGWLTHLEGDMKYFDEANIDQQAELLANMEDDINNFRTDLDHMNVAAGQLTQVSPPNAEHLREIALALNKRFDAACDLVQRRAERLDMTKKRSMEVLHDIDDLLEWLYEAQQKMISEGSASASAEVARNQLRNQKTMNGDIVAQKGRARDLVTSVKKVLRDLDANGDETVNVQHKLEELKDLAESVNQLSLDRLSVLEQVVPLAEDFEGTHEDLDIWLAHMEHELANCPTITYGLHPEQLSRQKAHNKELVDSIQAQRPVVDKFEKTTRTLATLVVDEDANRVREVCRALLDRLAHLKEQVRTRDEGLDMAMHESSQFSDKLDLMLANLSDAVESVRNPEPIAARPERLRSQIADNCQLIADLEQKTVALQAVKDAAEDIVAKADPNDPAVDEIKTKLGRVDELWNEIQGSTEERGRTLADTLAVAEMFWEELEQCMEALNTLRRRLDTETSPACEPDALAQQTGVLQEIGAHLAETQPRIEQVRETSAQLLSMVGASEQPEIHMSLGALADTNDTVTSLCASRNGDLLEAMERAMAYHEMLRGLLEWLNTAENQLEGAAPATSMSFEEIEKELQQLDAFRREVDEHAVHKEQLGQAAYELTENASPAQAAVVRKPLQDLNRRWDRMAGAINDRQQKLERALLEMGHFQSACDQLLDWMANTNQTLSDISPSPGDLRQNEIELAKHKVVSNDIGSHEASVLTLRAAADRMPDDGGQRKRKVDEMNNNWDGLQTLMTQKLEELNKAKLEAESFGGDVEKWLQWVSDMDQIVSASKPTAGMPDTARQQLEQFVAMEHDIVEKTPEVEKLLTEGDRYMEQAPENANSHVAQRLKSLRNKWNQMLVKKGDRKIKLEIALRDAEAFHQMITDFNNWLAEAEQTLNTAKSVSRLLPPLNIQMQEHNELQKDVQEHREAATAMQTKGQTLQYYCEKKDAIPIKNLQVSAKRRFDKVASRTADRTRQLDTGFRETTEFCQCHEKLGEWIDQAREQLFEATQQPASNPEKVREQLGAHKDFQRELGIQQSEFDRCMKLGKQIKDRAPVLEQPKIQETIDDIRERWNQICTTAVERQRTLEEGLLLSGQFNEAVSALLEWLKNIEPQLAPTESVRGDLETVNQLIDQQKALKHELQARASSVETVRKAADELRSKSDAKSCDEIDSLMGELDARWDQVRSLTEQRDDRLRDAESEAQSFHSQANGLLEWLEQMQTKLRKVGAAAHNRVELQTQTEKLKELSALIELKESDKDAALELGSSIQSDCHSKAEQPMKHWMAVLQSRWKEVTDWSTEKNAQVADEMFAAQQHDSLLDELVQWVNTKNDELDLAEEIPLPDHLEKLNKLIEEHDQFEAELRDRQSEVDEATKSKRAEIAAASTAEVKDTPKSGKTGRVKATVEPEPKKTLSPKAKTLQLKWRSLWLGSVDRKRKLNEHLNLLSEMKRLESFNWDEWRGRYMRWINNKKSRALDYFKREDKNGDGRLGRDHFNDIILGSKFPTTRLEIDKVADLFDNGDGMVDYREFVNALRPDRSLKEEPVTDQEKIQDEMTRQTRQCTCSKQYAIDEVGEGKYKFGENQKMRLVRILRSTVMVRVGGGWEALDEFLMKHDPCRAKGRTNLELREKFILAEGVTQNMQAFTDRRLSQSPSQSPSTSRGPITKIREKTERSSPMSSSPRRGRGAASPRTPRSSLAASKSNDLDLEVASIASTGSDNSRLPIPRSIGGAPSSRNSSRPPSRAGSECGSDYGGFQTRIPSIRKKQTTTQKKT